MKKNDLKKLKRLAVVVYSLLLIFNFSFYMRSAAAKTAISGNMQLTYNEATFLKGNTNMVPGHKKIYDFSLKNLGTNKNKVGLLIHGAGATKKLCAKINLKIKQGTKVLLSGTIKDLANKQKIFDQEILDGALESYKLQIEFDPSADNSYQGVTAQPVNLTLGFEKKGIPGGGGGGGFIGGGITFPFFFGGPGATEEGEVKGAQKEKETLEQPSQADEEGEVKGEGKEEEKNYCWVWWLMLVVAAVLIILHYLVIWNKGISLFWLTPLIIVVGAQMIDFLAHRYLLATKWCHWLWLMLLAEFIISGLIYYLFKLRHSAGEEE